MNKNPIALEAIKNASGVKEGFGQYLVDIPVKINKNWHFYLFKIKQISLK